MWQNLKNLQYAKKLHCQIYLVCQYRNFNNNILFYSVRERDRLERNGGKSKVNISLSLGYIVSNFIELKNSKGEVRLQEEYKQTKYYKKIGKN